jgi:hypothetical protein
MLVDMVDPKRQTTTVTDYGYRQLITRPLIGGGFITALSVPVIVSLGLTTFTILTTGLTVALVFCGSPELEPSGRPDAVTVHEEKEEHGPCVTSPAPRCPSLAPQPR